MKFKIKIRVGSDKKGVALLREYIRLRFPDDARPNSFRGSMLTIDVPEHIALRHANLFEYTDTVVGYADSTYTRAEDWESWGAHGMVLKEISNSTELIQQLLSQDKEPRALKQPAPALENKHDAN